MNIIDDPVFIGFIIFEVVVITIWILASAYMKKYRREHKYDEYFSAEMYVATPTFLIKATTSLKNKKEKYLKEHEDSDNYIFLKELFDILPRLYNEYAQAVLHTPLAMTKSPNPYTAAYLGTMIGGVAVGMVAAHNAIEKQKAYEQNVKDVFLSKFETGNAYDKLNDCYWSIISILEQKESTKSDWENTVDEIIEKCWEEKR